MVHVLQYVEGVEAYTTIFNRGFFLQKIYKDPIIVIKEMCYICCTTNSFSTFIVNIFVQFWVQIHNILIIWKQ